MTGDKLIIETGAKRFALDTSAVSGIVEIGRVPFLPGQSGFVSGIISLRSEPVTVVDLGKVFGITVSEEGAHRIIVVKDSSRLLGLDAGEASISFLWEEELKDCSVTEEKGLYTKGFIETEETRIEVIDWQSLFDDASRILSTETSGV